MTSSTALRIPDRSQGPKRPSLIRSPATARVLLSELAHAPDALVTTVTALEGEIEREQGAAEELAKTRRDADISKLVRPFAVVFAVACVVGMGVGTWHAWQAAHTDYGFPVRQAMAMDSVLFLILIVSLIVARRSLFATAATRRTIMTYAIGGTGMFAADFVTFALGHGTSDAAAHTQTMLCVIVAIVAVTTTRRALAALPVTIGCLVAIIAWPRFAPVFAMLGILTSGLVFIHAFGLEAAKTRTSK